jgi:hypothetical protein
VQGSATALGYRAPMVRHVVLLRLAPETPSRVIDGIVGRLRELPERIEVIRRYEVGRDLGLASGNATIVVLGDFDDDAAYRTYRDHPEHRRVIDDHLAPVLEERSAIQYELS